MNNIESVPEPEMQGMSEPPIARADTKCRIQSKAMMLVYIGVLVDIKNYRRCIIEPLLGGNGCRGDISKLSLVHRECKQTNRKRTYVILEFSEPLRSRMHDKLTYKGIVPEVRPFRHPSQLGTGIAYIRQWKYPPPPQRPVIAPPQIIVREPEVPPLNILPASDRPVKIRSGGFVG